MTVNLISLWGLEVAVAFGLPRGLGWGATGVWWGRTLANLANGSLLGLWFGRGGRSTKTSNPSKWPMRNRDPVLVRKAQEGEYSSVGEALAERGIDPGTRVWNCASER
jgi:hypothetical protein